MANNDSGMTAYVREQFRTVAEYDMKQALEATDTRFETAEQKSPGGLRLVKFYKAINDASLRLTMIECAANPIFREIINARIYELQAILTNIPYELDDKKFKLLYASHHIELEVYHDILELLKTCQDDLVKIQQETQG